jgi:hypothetical protein
MMGYHLKSIPKGVFGEASKIEEEFRELEDALVQNNKIMALVELSDMLGAIRGFLSVHFPGFSIDDLITMSEATERAFKDGTRK